MADPLRDAGIEPVAPVPADLPRPEGFEAGLTPEQRDVEAFQQRAGEFRKGLRMGANLSLASVNALAGAAGDALGAHEFARDRMDDAHRLADFGSAVGPRIRDYRAVKDFSDVVDFTAGMLGQGASYMAPTFAAGLAGSRFGLRGAAVSAGIPSFGLESGEQVLRTEEAPGTLGQKLPAALAKGAAAAALDVAVPVAGAMRLQRAARGAGRGGVGLATGAAGEAATEAAQEKIGQIAHTAVEPGRETAEDVPEMINAALMGAVSGGAFGAGVHVASKAGENLLGGRRKAEPYALPENRAYDAKEAMTVLGEQGVPRTPADGVGFPLDGTEQDINAWMDATDEQIEARLAREEVARPRKWANYEGWRDDPEIRDQFAEAVAEDYGQTVARPEAARAVEEANKAVDGLRPKGSRRSRVRTALDMQVFDIINQRAPGFVADLSGEDRARLADAVKTYVMHQWGRREAAPEGGTRLTPIPKQLTDIFGEGIGGLLAEVHDVLGKGGIPMQPAPNFERMAEGLRRNVAEARAPLEQAVLRHLRPELAYNLSPAERQQVVTTMTSQLTQALNRGVPNWGELNAKLEYAFGPNADAVLEAFEGARKRMTSQYEDLQDVGEVAVTEEGEVVPEQAAPEEESSPYRDARLQVPYTMDQAGKALEALRSEYNKANVRFRAVPQVVDGALTGKVNVVAEDAQAPGAFDEAELARVREKQGKGGLKSGVVTIKRQNPNDPSRNELVAISIPNLVAETKRTFKFEGGQTGRTYTQAVVLEALSRLYSRTSEPTAEGPKGDEWHLANRSKFELANLPDDTVVTYRGIGRNRTPVTWADIKPRQMTEKQLKTASEVDALVERVQQAQNMAEVDEIIDSEHPDIVDAADERLQQEAERRRFEGDRPLGESRGAIDIQEEIVPQAQREAARRVRTYQEETGLPVQGEARAEGVTGGELATGIPERERKSGPTTVYRRKAQKGETKLAKSSLAANRIVINMDLARKDFESGFKYFLGQQDQVAEYLANFEQGQTVDMQLEEWLSRQLLTDAQAEALGNAADRMDTGFEIKTDYGTFLVEGRGDHAVTQFRKEDGPQTSLSSQQKGVVAKRLGLTPEKLKKMFPTVKAYVAFLRAHEQSHLAHMDSATYPKTKDGKPDLMAKKAIDIETRATREAIAETQAALKQGKLSKVKVGPSEISEADMANVRDYVEQVLGDKAEVVFKALDDAGGFEMLNGVERLVFSMHMIDPMSVAAHEAAHGLMQRLRVDPRARTAMNTAASSPAMVARLRKLLADEPAALEQLSDPEERVAYMFQFWSQGQLQVGPKTQTFFEKIATMVRKVFKALTGVGDDVASLEAAERIMRAFHDGLLANRSAVSRKMADILGERQGDDAVAKLTNLADRTFSTADGYIRDMRIPAFTATARKFYSEHGGEPGMIQARLPKRNQLMNRYTEITRGFSEEEKAKVAEAMQGGNRALPSNLTMKERRAAGELRKLLDEIYDYMRESNVKVVSWDEKAKKYVEHTMRRVRNYFPRVYDREKLTENAAAFKGMLLRNGIQNPDTAYSNLTNQEHAPPGESDFVAGMTPFSPAATERQLNIPAADLEPYLLKDLDAIMHTYIAHTVRRAEYAKRFGNRGQVIKDAIKQGQREGATPDQVKGFTAYVQAMEGSLGGQIDPKLKNLMSGVQTYQNLRLLPLALFSSLVDPNGIALRSGQWREAPKAFARGVRELFSNKVDEARHLARAIGAINEATDEHMVAEMYGPDSQGLSRWLNRKLFQLNGMESWNNSMRIHAAAVGQKFIIRHVTEPGEHSARYLEELGLSPGDVRIDTVMVPKRDGMLVEEQTLELTPQVVDALNRFVDSAVIRPHAAHRPVWMSDPHFMLITHLKQFTYSFQKTIVSRALHEATHGNYKPIMVLSSYVPFIIAADMLRAIITPGGMDDSRWDRWDATDWLYHGVKRSGITGPGEYALNVGEGRVTDVLGPTAQQLTDLVSSAGDGDKFSRQLLRAVPPVPVLSLR